MLAKISGALIKPGSISGDVLSGSLEINTVNVSGSLTGSDATFSGHITASALKGDGSAITGVLSSSYALSSSYTDAVEYTHILHKPTLVSSSAQFVTLTDPFSGSFTGSFKGDAANLTGTISSSYAVSSSNAGAIDYNNVYNRPTLVSSSAQFNSLTAPFTGSFTGSFKGDATTGYVSASNIYVSDTLTARQVMTRYVSSSIIYESGSTKFGDSLDDVHQVTGSMNITGSLTATFVSGTLSGAFPYSSLTGLPTLVSQSAQVDYNSIQNYVIAVTGSSVYTNTLTNTVNSNNSIFFGDSAGYIASQSIYSNFFGYYAGYQSYKAQYSNFFGSEAGREAPSVSYSNFLGYRAGYQATNASNANFLGPNAGYIASQSNNANFLGASAGYQAYAADNSNFFGFQAGYQASQSNFSNYFGQQAGYQAYKGNYSNFLGVQAGYQASQSSYSNFLGQSAGNGASNAFQSNFFGGSAGYLAYSAQNSNFFGYTAGYQASQSNNANYIGYQAGYNAAGASNSNFFGRNAGYRAVNASYSTLIGYQAGYAPTTADSIGSNNIIIGTNITLPAGTVNAISLGNVIYVTGSYSTTSGNPSSASKTDGKVGIATFNPQTYIQVGDHTVAGVAGKGHIYVNGLNNVDDGFYVDRGVAGEYGWINYQGGSFTLGTKGSTGHGYFRILSYSGSTAVERMTIDNIGSVGIGTTTPVCTLHVSGNISNQPVAIFKQGNASNGGWIVVDSPTDSTNNRPSSMTFSQGGNLKWSIGSGYNDTNVGFSIASSDLQSGITGIKFYVSSSGYTGIGTTSPTTKLTVYDASSAARIEINGSYYQVLDFKTTANTNSRPFRLIANDNYGVFEIRGGAAYNTADPATLALAIKNDGNVGIGEITPLDKVVVAGVESINMTVRSDSSTASTRPAIRLMHTGGSLTTPTPNDSRLGVLSWMGVSSAGNQYNYSFIDSFISGAPTQGAASSYMAFYTTVSGNTGAERMRIHTNGNVGIGTTSPTTKLDIYDADGATTIRLQNAYGVGNGGLYGYTRLIGLTGGNGAFISHNVNGVSGGASALDDSTKPGEAISIGQNYGGIAFMNYAAGAGTVTPTVSMFITDAGKVLVGKTTTTSNGGVLQVSNGITFPAAQSACSDVNTLDDYKEGTFTPTLFYQNTTGVTRTYTSQYGQYTKIGNVVNFKLYLAGATSNSGVYANDNIGIAGLPYTGSADNSMRSFATVVQTGFAGSGNLGGVVGLLGSDVVVTFIKADNYVGNLADDFGAGATYTIWVSGTYFV